MFAVESALQGLRERGCAQIVSEHRRPRDGLQHGPVGAGRREQRSDQQDMAESGEHIRTLENWRAEVKICLNEICLSESGCAEASGRPLKMSPPTRGERHRPGMFALRRSEPNDRSADLLIGTKKTLFLGRADQVIGAPVHQAPHSNQIKVANGREP